MDLGLSPAVGDCKSPAGKLHSYPVNELIAVVEDEQDILSLVTASLQKERFRVKGFHDGRSFLDALSREVPELVVLDLMLPDLDGFEVCRRLKRDERFSSLFIIMLTARAEESDRVSGLELGADDYMVKPFSPKELAARVKAVLRRSERAGGKQKKIEVGGSLVIDLDTVEVIANGRKLDLTATEFKIIQFLASRKGWVFSREKILDHLWGSEKSVTDRSVDVHIKHLRDKLGAAGKHIRNVRGIGYKIVE
jgi:DNA-binding response OmpR family regulator